MDRKQRILELLHKKNTLYLKELEVEFPEVSAMTLRRDLSSLEEMGEAVRIKGGVRSVRSFGAGRQEDVYELRLGQNAESKAKIAKLAQSFIETGRSIYMDSGTTMLALARTLPDTNLSILTSCPHVALTVIKKYLPTVNLIGGQLNRLNSTISGMQAMDFVKGYNFDVAFLVPSAFSLEKGLSCGNDAECELKKYIINNASLKIALVDSSKFGKSMPFTFSSFEDINVLITDEKPSDEILDFSKEKGISVIWK